MKSQSSSQILTTNTARAYTAKRPQMTNQKAREPLTKVTIRLFADDMQLLREHFHGHYGTLGVNEVIRTIVREWTDRKLRSKNGDPK